MPDSLESLVAVAIDNIEDLKREVERNRDSIHALQSTVQGVAMLKAAVDELHRELPNLARQAAREAVTEGKRRDKGDARANWRLVLTAFSTGAAVVGVIVAIVTLVLSH